jgi:DNA replication protein DnaC
MYVRWDGCPLCTVISEWDSIFGDNMMTVAAIDRLVHHSKIYQLEGESYRKKHAMQSNPKTGQVN